MFPCVPAAKKRQRACMTYAHAASAADGPSPTLVEFTLVVADEPSPILVEFTLVEPIKSRLSSPGEASIA